MNKLLIILLSLFSISSFSASVTVHPFNLEFDMDTDAYELDFSLEMVCRYEKFVISDSSEYEYIYKKVPLKIEKVTRNNSELSTVTITNSQKEVLKLTGYFKSNKECQTYLKFFFVDRIYAVGWANQFNRPIKLGHFKHSRLEENKVFNYNELNNYLGNKKISFNYVSTGHQINVRLAFDDISTRGMSSYLSQSVAENPETNLPYRLQK